MQEREALPGEDLATVLLELVANVFAKKTRRRDVP